MTEIMTVGAVMSDGKLPEELTDLLAFNWETILTDGDSIEVGLNSDPMPGRWRLTVNRMTRRGDTLLHAEVPIWEQSHQDAGRRWASLTGASLSMCPDCGAQVTLGGWGEHLGFWMCVDDVICVWTEVGYQADDGDHILTCPWTVTIRSYGRGGDVIVRIDCPDVGGFEIQRETFEEAEFAAFTWWCEQVGT